jgi:hypothetical protein
MHRVAMDGGGREGTTWRCEFFILVSGSERERSGDLGL